MTQTTYQVNVSLEVDLEQLKQIILTMPPEQQDEIIQLILDNRSSEKNSINPLNSKKMAAFYDAAKNYKMQEALKNTNNTNMINVFERISQNAEARGLTEEILEELLADES